MTRLGLSALTVALVFTSLLSVGCCQQEKQQVAALQAQYNDLTNQNKDLRNQLAQSKSREAEMLAQMDAKGLQMTGRDQEISRLQAELQQKPAVERQPQSPENWDVGKYADKITVGSDILFDSGQATLTTKGKSALDKIISDLKANYPAMPVRVFGYTDSDPIKRTKKLWQDNLDLSANRAMAVTRYLVGKGIQAESVETVAMGATHFAAKNSSQISKSRNRRVEIVVVKR